MVRGAPGAGLALTTTLAHGFSSDGLRLLRTAVRGWLGFMDGACLDWIEHRDLDRETLHGLLLGTLMGAVLAATES